VVTSPVTFGLHPARGLHRCGPGYANSTHCRLLATAKTPNPYEMNTYEKCAYNPPRMNTYKIIGLKVLLESTLTEKGGGGGRNSPPNTNLAIARTRNLAASWRCVNFLRSWPNT